MAPPTKITKSNENLVQATNAERVYQGITSQTGTATVLELSKKERLICRVLQVFCAILTLSMLGSPAYRFLYAAYSGGNAPIPFPFYWWIVELAVVGLFCFLMYQYFGPSVYKLEVPKVVRVELVSDVIMLIAHVGGFVWQVGVPVGVGNEASNNYNVITASAFFASIFWAASLFLDVRASSAVRRNASFI